MSSAPSFEINLFNNSAAPVNKYSLLGISQAGER